MGPTCDARYYGEEDLDVSLGDWVLLHDPPQHGGSGRVVLCSQFGGRPLLEMGAGAVASAMEGGMLFINVRSGERLELHIEQVQFHLPLGAEIATE